MAPFRFAAVFAACALLAACGGGKAQTVTTDDMDMGKADAPVTVIEYASVACPVCARFDVEVFPEFKTKYIDTGQVHYVFREILAHNPQMAASGFMLARCAGKDKYFDVLNAIFKDRDAIEENLGPGLSKAAKSAGMSQGQVDKCLADTAAIDALNARVQKNSDIGHISGTPSFDINGVQYDHYMSLADLDEAIAKAKAKK